MLGRPQLETQSPMVSLMSSSSCAVVQLATFGKNEVSLSLHKTYICLVQMLRDGKLIILGIQVDLQLPKTQHQPLNNNVNKMLPSEVCPSRLPPQSRQCQHFEGQGSDHTSKHIKLCIQAAQTWAIMANGPCCQPASDVIFLLGQSLQVICKNGVSGLPLEDPHAFLDFNHQEPA